MNRLIPIHLPPGWVHTLCFAFLFSPLCSFGQQGELLPNVLDSNAVGYGILRQTNAGSSVYQLKAARLRGVLRGNFLTALQGNVPGLLLTANSGAPGDGVSLTMGGAGRFGDTNPLVVVDGLVLGQTSNLNWLAWRDVESVAVLRDAPAAAYGMRAANGVILISTRKGQPGGLRVSAETYTGVQSVRKLPAQLSTAQYIDYINESRVRGGFIPSGRLANRASLDTLLRVQTNWLDELMQVAPVHNSSVSVSGASDAASYFVSTDYYRQKGILAGTDLSRFSMRANLGYAVTNTVRVGTHLAWNRVARQLNERAGTGTPIEQALKSAPYLPVQNPRNPGGFNGPDFGDAGNDAVNAVGLASLVNDQRTAAGLVGDVFGEWNPLENLTYRFTFGFDRRKFSADRTVPVYRMGAFDSNPRATAAASNMTWRNRMLEHQLIFRETFGDHALMALLAGSTQLYRADKAAAVAGGVPDRIEATTSAATSAGEYRIHSLLTRVEYTFLEKYGLIASLRRDGSSRFASGHRMGWFPAVSGFYRLSAEPFFEQIPYLSELRLQAGVGQTGNDHLGDFRYTTRMLPGFNYPFGAGSSYLGEGSVPGALSNPRVRWETTTLQNLGAELAAFENKIRIGLDYRTKHTRDILVEEPIPAATGTAAPLTNAGEVKNRSVDLTFGVQESMDDFSVNLNAFLSWQRNEVVSIGQRTSPIWSASVQNEYVGITTPGQPIGSYFGLQKIGIYQTKAEIGNSAAFDGTEPGDVRFADSNGDKKLTLEGDRTLIGQSLPTFHYGFSLNASGQGFDLSIQGQGVSGHQLYNAMAYWLNGYQGRYNAGTQVLDRWTPERPSLTQPRATAGNTHNFRASDWFVENGSYLRLRHVEVGYTLPETLTSGYGLRSVRLFVSAQNLITVTRYSGLDPEFSAGNTLLNGIDAGVTPQPRTIVGGLQVNF
ncbi:SusC/RagA family TonB-linked outer membrane protein [Tellurirhabdus rosea]|uniref:SusC/RagA family TonB-linked outer membrane protein n=1 Tax=Tellurirhabdus rosea TaxID=2674997 RepID=UPI00225A11E1|nr:SusC/RagA family TonB-linked outer membrane protein [Tellurirhabdus rosea]